MTQLRTVCGAELWSGFFGVDADGTQPECTCEIFVETDEYEEDGDDIHLPFSVECPECGMVLEWPQVWETAECNAG